MTAFDDLVSVLFRVAMAAAFGAGVVYLGLSLWDLLQIATAAAFGAVVVYLIRWWKAA